MFYLFHTNKYFYYVYFFIYVRGLYDIDIYDSSILVQHLNMHIRIRNHI